MLTELFAKYIAYIKRRSIYVNIYPNGIGKAYGSLDSHFPLESIWRTAGDSNGV